MQEMLEEELRILVGRLLEEVEEQTLRGSRRRAVWTEGRASAKPWGLG